MSATAFEVPSIYDLCGTAHPAAPSTAPSSGTKAKAGRALSSIVLIGSVVLVIGGICWIMYKREEERRKQLYDTSLKRRR
jgi:hypothetical protein